MKQNLKFFISSALVTVTFSTPWEIQGMDDICKLGEHQRSSGMQLKKGAGDTLEAVLGTGDDVLLKLSMDLSALKRPLEQGRLEKGQLEVPFRLFLTDFTSSPTAYPAVELTTRIECESTSPACVLPNKPQSFDSYSQFTDWLKRGYFTNQVDVTYDFHVDVEKSAPTLAQQLFAVRPGGYCFIGTYEVNNNTIQPDQCVPQVTYASKRGNTNATIATLEGTFYLNGHPYPIDSHYQSFPHPIIDQAVFKKDETKRFYSHKWVAKSEATAKITYEEFPRHQVHNWPNAPVGSYSILKKTPSDFEEIKHLGCWDGASGEEVNISDGRTFLTDCETINTPQLLEGAKFTESIVKDDAGNLYTVHYQHSEAEWIKKQEIEQRDKKEQIALWGTGIDITLNHIRDLQNYNLTYGELETRMKDMIPHYTTEGQIRMISKENSMDPDRIREIITKGLYDGINIQWSRIENRIQHLVHDPTNHRVYAQLFGHTRDKTNERYSWDIIRAMMELEIKKILDMISRYVEMKMEKYLELTKTRHPLWDEFLKL